MIHVGINARALAKPNPAGVSQYTRSLLSALAERAATADPGLEISLFGLDALPEPLASNESVERADEPVPVHSGPGAHYWEQFVLPRVLRGYDLDVFHTPAGQPPMLSSLSVRDASRPALVTTVHDVSPITHPEWFSRRYAAVYRALTPLAIRASERVLTVSEFARNEIVGVYPSAADKTVVTYNGVTPPAEPGTPVDALETGDFLLFVGAVNRRKNVGTLLESYRRYRARTTDPVELALAGPERDVFAEHGYELPPEVRTLGYVSDEQLGWLYRNASVFCFPSLYEGFGLPVIEAMHAGTPVVVSDRGAMAEVAGNAAELVDPQDPAALVGGIERILAEGDYRRTLVARGRERAASFTWERTAAGVVETYRAAAGR